MHVSVEGESDRGVQLVTRKLDRHLGNGTLAARSVGDAGAPVEDPDMNTESRAIDHERSP